MLNVFLSADYTYIITGAAVGAVLVLLGVVGAAVFIKYRKKPKVTEGEENSCCFRDKGSNIYLFMTRFLVYF